MTPMLAGLMIVVIMTVFAVLALADLIAPVGWQDWRGFHLGDPDTLSEHEQSQRQATGEWPRGDGLGIETNHGEAE